MSSHTVLGLLALTVAVSFPLVADNQPQSTHQFVPPEHWSYGMLRDVLREAPIRGLSPTRLQGAFTFNATEMAEMAWKAYEHERDHPSDRASVRRALSALLGEYSWVLESAGRPVGDALAALHSEFVEGADVAGSLTGGLVASSAGAHSDLTADASIALWPNSSQAFGIVGTTFRPSDAGQDRLGRPLLERAAFYWRRPDYQLTVGRDYLTMGLGVRGTYGFGSVADPAEQIRYRDRIQLFGTRFVVDMALASREQSGQRVRLLTRRLEKRLSPEIEVALTESGQFLTGPSWPYYLTIMHVASLIEQNVLTGLAAQDNDNLMVGVDLYWKASPYAELYGELAVDELDGAAWLDAVGLYRPLANWQFLKDLGIEIHAPGVHESVLGSLVGVYLPDVLGNDRLSLRGEFASSSRRFGIGTRTGPLDYFDDGRPLQHRLGPDGKGVYVEAKYFAGDWALRGFVERSSRRLSLPTPERETLVGLIGVRELGRDTSARLGLWYRDVSGVRNVAGSRQTSLTTAAGVRWEF